jgi:hypothetical protein
VRMRFGVNYWPEHTHLLVEVGLNLEEEQMRIAVRVVESVVALLGRERICSKVEGPKGVRYTVIGLEESLVVVQVDHKTALEIQQ